MPVVPEDDKLPEGEPVTVQLPEDGKPLNATLAVAVAHVGCVIVPTVGAEGVTDTVTVADALLVHSPVARTVAVI